MPLNFSELGWWGRIFSEMKTLFTVLIGLLVAGDVSYASTKNKNDIPQLTSKSKKRPNDKMVERVSALRIIEDGLKGFIFDVRNPKRYMMSLGENEISFVSRVPNHYPGDKEFKGQNLRRLTFSVSDKNGKSSLILEQGYVGEKEPVIHSVIATNVDVFGVFYWSSIIEDWIDGWNANTTPLRIKIYLALKQSNGLPALENDLRSCEVVIKKNTVPNWAATELAIEKSIRKVLGKPKGTLTRMDYEKIKTLGLFLPPSFPKISEHRRITDVSLLTSLTKMEELYCVNGTKIDEDGLINLKNRLPNCEIIVHAPVSRSRGRGRSGAPSHDENFINWSKRVPKQVRDRIDSDKDGKLSDDEKKRFLEALNKRLLGSRHE